MSHKLLVYTHTTHNLFCLAKERCLLVLKRK